MSTIDEKLFVIAAAGGYHVPATIIWDACVKENYEDREDSAIVGYNSLLKTFFIVYDPDPRLSSDLLIDGVLEWDQRKFLGSRFKKFSTISALRSEMRKEGIIWIVECEKTEWVDWEPPKHEPELRL